MRTKSLTAAVLALVTTALAHPGGAHAQETSASASASDDAGQSFLSERLSVGAGAEIDLIGLAYGVRPELLFMLSTKERRSHVRVAAGVMAGPEITFVPINLGYRLIFSPGRSARAHVGTGLERQNFWYGGDSPKSRWAMYTETGFEFEIFDKGWVGLQYAPDFGIGSFGLGFATRATFRYDL